MQVWLHKIFFSKIVGRNSIWRYNGLNVCVSMPHAQCAGVRRGVFVTCLAPEGGAPRKGISAPLHKVPHRVAWSLPVGELTREGAGGCTGSNAGRASSPEHDHPEVWFLAFPPPGCEEDISTVDTPAHRPPPCAACCDSSLNWLRSYIHCKCTGNKLCFANEFRWWKPVLFYRFEKATISQ